MNDLRKAAEMALEFMSWLTSDDHSIRPHKAPDIIEALRQALDDKPDLDWVGLTPTEFNSIKDNATTIGYAIIKTEAMLREKNSVSRD